VTWKGIIIAVLAVLLWATAAAAETDAEAAKRIGLLMVDAPALRAQRGTGIYADVLAHDDKPQRWDSITTAAHEGTHGANSAIRNRYGGWDKCNAMYVCGNRGILVAEPAVSLEVVARYVPADLHGMSWNTYFGSELKEWRYNTLYPLDEWSAYVNGAWVGAERGAVGHSDGLQTAEFTVYCLAATVAVIEQKPSYDARQMRAAVAWMIERRVLILLNNPGAEAGRAHLDKFRTSPSAERLRQSVRLCFGEAWANHFLGV
jgi:hypothetical protein